MMEKQEATLFGVARNETIIGNHLFNDVDMAKRHLVNVEDGMRAADLEPDVRIVTVKVTTTYSRPHVYKDPSLEELHDPVNADGVAQDQDENTLDEI